MNWSDIIVLAIIGGFAVIGMMNGFISSVFRLTSSFVSALLSIKLYPVLSKVLINSTGIYGKIKDSILNSLLAQKSKLFDAGSTVQNSTADTVIENLKLPGFLKDMLHDKIPNPAQILPVEELANKLSGYLAELVIDVISLVLIFIIIRIVLIIVRFILKGITKLPVFKQIDKLGGLALGALEGFLAVYLLVTIIMLFHTLPQFAGIFKAINSSAIARFFYEKNFIVSWMFPS